MVSEGHTHLSRIAGSSRRLTRIEVKGGEEEEMGESCKRRRKEKMKERGIDEFISALGPW
uniref:BHLH domain-containing protein n=1 Tax=Heterorhabditis bacteriophora TaxID=37862 RepID=A0A1I7XSV7_HETBA